jgi:hypothetical protein
MPAPISPKLARRISKADRVSVGIGIDINAARKPDPVLGDEATPSWIVIAAAVVQEPGAVISRPVN